MVGAQTDVEAVKAELQALAFLGPAEFRRAAVALGADLRRGDDHYDKRNCLFEVAVPDRYGVIYRMTILRAMVMEEPLGGIAAVHPDLCEGRGGTAQAAVADMVILARMRGRMREEVTCPDYLHGWGAIRGLGKASALRWGQTQLRRAV